MVVKDCDKCKCSIVWDATAHPVKDSKREKEGKLGWFREDLSKQLHTIDRCKNFTASKEFMKEPQSVLNAQTNPDIQKAPSPLQVKEMDVVDFAEPKLRREFLVELKNLKILEEEVIKFIGTDAGGAKVGLWMKLVKESMKK